jgi:hypothetical protein
MEDMFPLGAVTLEAGEVGRKSRVSILLQVGLMVTSLPMWLYVFITPQHENDYLEDIYILKRNKRIHHTELVITTTSFSFTPCN